MEVGAALRAAREERKLTLQDVQRELMIRERYLAALEEDRIDDIPGLAYARGFLRSYATFLNIDADEMLAQLPEPEGQQAPVVEQPAPPPVTIGHLPPRRSVQPLRRRRSPTWLWLVLGGIVVVAAAIYFVTRHPARRASAPPATTTHKQQKQSAKQSKTTAQGGQGGNGSQTASSSGGASAPSVAAAGQTTSPFSGGVEYRYTVVSGPIQVQIKLTAPCWTEARTDGGAPVAKTYGAGTHIFTAKKAFLIKLGRPQAASMTIDGQAIKLQGKSALSVGVQVQSAGG